MPCNALKINRRFGGTCLNLQGRRISQARNQHKELCLSPSFTLVSCSAYSSTPKMEAICSSETSVDFQRIARRYIPEDSTLHNHRCENLKSYMFFIKFCVGNLHQGLRSRCSEMWRCMIWYLPRKLHGRQVPEAHTLDSKVSFTKTVQSTFMFVPIIT
jgi:hypothetical protein